MFSVTLGVFKRIIGMIKFETVELSDHTFTKTVHGTKYVYEVSVLIQYAKEQKYKVFDLPLAGINLSDLMWGIVSMRDIAYHLDRINKTDFKHPILIDDRGVICDGWHRVMKAIMLGHNSIKAIRLLDMPLASNTEDIE